MLEALSASEDYGIILRAKGMLPAEDGTWIYFDMVPEETEIREGAPEYTGRLCVIGSKLKEDKLAELFGLAEQLKQIEYVSEQIRADLWAAELVCCSLCAQQQVHNNRISIKE